MISRRIAALGAVFTLLLVILCVATSAPSSSNVSVRKFEFTCQTKIPASPAGAKTLRVWIPVPQSGPYQTIDGLKIESPFPYVRCVTHLKAVFAGRKLVELTADAIEQYLRDRLEQRVRVRTNGGYREKGALKSSTVHQELRVLRRMLNIAVRKKLLAANR